MSFHLGKKFQCRNKVSKSFAKFTRAVKKTPRRIADLLGSTLSLSHNRRIPDTTYGSINSVYECPCNYHHCKRQELGSRRLPNLGGEGRGHAMVRPESDGVVSDHNIESENESVGGDIEAHAVERRRDESGTGCSSPFEVNERAERFIETFRKSFNEDPKLQRQMSVHDH